MQSSVTKLLSLSARVHQALFLTFAEAAGAFCSPPAPYNGNVRNGEEPHHAFK